MDDVARARVGLTTWGPLNEDNRKTRLAARSLFRCRRPCLYDASIVLRGGGPPHGPLERRLPAPPFSHARRRLSLFDRAALAAPMRNGIALALMVMLCPWSS
jgi:hypothetical protein